MFDVIFILMVFDDCVYYLIKRLLLVDEYLKFEDLVDELYISKLMI